MRANSIAPVRHAGCNFIALLAFIQQFLIALFFHFLPHCVILYLYILLLLYYYLLFLLSSLFCVDFEKQNLVGQGIVIFILYLWYSILLIEKNIYKNGNFHWFWVFLLSYYIFIAKTSLKSFECYIMKKKNCIFFLCENEFFWNSFSRKNMQQLV